MAARGWSLQVLLKAAEPTLQQFGVKIMMASFCEAGTNRCGTKDDCSLSKRGS